MLPQEDMIADIPPAREKFFGCSGKMLLPSPATVAAFIRKIPQSQLVTMDLLRRELATQFQVQATCPVAARKALQAVARQPGVDGWWRVVKTNGELLAYLPGGREGQAALLEAEGITINRSGKAPRVMEFREKLVHLPQEWERMNTLFAISSDGVRVAYDVSGAGPAIVLLHGGGGSRQEWHAAGTLDRLRGEFTVIAMDLRGHGESELPDDPACYTTDRMGDDILAVADACGTEHITIWGVSFGGNVGRYLAARSPRVRKLILLGSPLGPGVSGRLRRMAEDYCTHWPSILQAQREGRLDVPSLSLEDQDMLQRFKMPVMLAWVRAMLDWPFVGPQDLLCPTLWLVGSMDEDALERVRDCEQSLQDSRVRLHILDGLNHDQVFSDHEQVFELMLAFTRE